MIKGLEYIKNELALPEYCHTTHDRRCLKQVEKELKALEIICSLIDIQVTTIVSRGEEFYALFLNGIEYWYISKEVYDLLKEVVDNE